MEYQFEKLNAWQESRKLVVATYQLLKKFPKEEQFALCDQLRRAVISVPSNIAEGNGRMAIKEQIHFLEIAYGSLTEVTCQLDIAQSLGYITDTELNTVEDMSIEVGRLLSGLRKSLIEKQSNNYQPRIAKIGVAGVISLLSPLSSLL